MLMSHFLKFSAVILLALLVGLTIAARGEALASAYRLRVLLSERVVLVNEGRALMVRLEHQRSPTVLLNNAARMRVQVGKRFGKREIARDAGEGSGE